MSYLSPRIPSLCCIAAAMLALTAPALGQEPTGVEAVVKTGLRGLYARHTMIATVADVAEPGAPRSHVVISFFDAHNNLLKSTTGDLAPGQSVELRLRHRELGVRKRRIPVRTEVEIVPEGDGSLNTPIVSVELFDPSLDLVAPGDDCPVPFPEPGANPQVFDCGCHVETRPIDR